MPMRVRNGLARAVRQVLIKNGVERHPLGIGGVGGLSVGVRARFFFRVPGACGGGVDGAGGLVPAKGAASLLFIPALLPIVGGFLAVTIGRH